MDTPLLESLTLPADLKSLDTTALTSLAAEIRSELVEAVSAVGGHLAPSLGVVELSLQLHRLFDSPRDRIVWDVGHQAYVHKVLTGRRGDLRSIRTSGGIAGYLKRSESSYDCFGAGHAGTSISAAVGMKLALNRRGTHGSPAPYVVAVVGDGALTAGMCFEALNHAGGIAPEPLSRFIVILNDNGMSIAENVGALSIQSKKLRSPGSECSAGKLEMLFRTLGFQYIGPIDGHDLAALETALLGAKRQPGPVFLHLLTTKGKGLPAAEADPAAWHGISGNALRATTFRQATRPDTRAVSTPRSASQRTLAAGSPPSLSSVFGAALAKEAARDSRIVGITAAMPSGTGLELLARERPSSFIDVGICEQHAVTLAAGLACEGMRPVVAIYSTFLQRGYDQLIHDVCIQNLPVTFVLDRAGLVGHDGETHQGVFDLAFLRAVPNLLIMAPRDERQLERMLRTALEHDGPSAIRFPRGNGIGLPLDTSSPVISPRSSEELRSGEDGLIVALGPLVYRACALATWADEQFGDRVQVIDARFVKPLDPALVHAAQRAPWTLVLEDHARIGGVGSALLEAVHDSSIALPGPITRVGVPDRFIPHGTVEEQHEWCGMDERSLRLWYERRRTQTPALAPCAGYTASAKPEGPVPRAA